MLVQRRTTGGASSTRPKRNLFRKGAPLVVAVLAPLVIFTSGPASAADGDGKFCFGAGTADIRRADQHKGRVTYAVQRQQANKTWQDWVWRGPVEQCPWNAPQNCTYTKAIAKTTSYQWSVGLTVGGDAKKEPFSAMASLVGGYGQSGSTTMTYTSGVWYRPGQFAQPISVVERRWRSGDFVGGFVRTPAYDNVCRNGNKGYRWDANIRWGNWADNIKVRDYGSFNIHN